MEAMEIFLAAARDLSYVSHVVASNPLYAAIGGFILLVALLRFYCRLTCGMCDSDQDMTGKTVLITGATAGIGKATAEDMARRNAKVILACRNLEKARRVAEKIISSTGNKNVTVKHLDLSSLETVRECAKDVLNSEEKLHVLINNAGVFNENREKTEDDHEYVLQCNHLGHFLLTLLLLDLLKKSAPSRIINVSSKAYRLGKIDINDMHAKKCITPMEAYSRSKLANILFTRELSSRLANSGVTVNALHPGVVKTDIIPKSRSFFIFCTILMTKTLGKSCEEGAQTTIYLAVHPDLDRTTGKFFSDCKEEKLVGQQALDKTLAKQFFEVSKKLVGLSDCKT